MAMIAARERSSVDVLRTCQLRKIMQRSFVFQVKSICNRISCVSSRLKVYSEYIHATHSELVVHVIVIHLGYRIGGELGSNRVEDVRTAFQEDFVTIESSSSLCCMSRLKAPRMIVT
jgi:hypothetical protein